MPKHMLRPISQRKFSVRTPMMTEITDDLSDIRRHYREA
jgi:hypothetical protein